ncbi:hypothetical protein N7523_002488 [Penicillium sp. IBT 18751x]|nr:hypothetical protein N7523_002488 [Penicillium sp. IBT 18751x]
MEDGPNGPETVGSLLQRLVENEEINRHIHAPQGSMQEQLREREAWTAITARRHQLFNFFNG